MDSLISGVLGGLFFLLSLLLASNNSAVNISRYIKESVKDSYLALISPLEIKCHDKVLTFGNAIS